MTALLVALGAAAGAPARLLVDRRLGSERATLLVNSLGSLLLGVVAAAGEPVVALVGTGFCGAFTTFSTYALVVVERAGWRYVALTTAACLSAAAIGLGVGAVLRG